MEEQRGIEGEKGNNLIGKLLGIRVRLPLVFILILLLLVSGGVVYAVTQKPEVLGLSRDSQAAAQAEIDKLIADIGRLIALPSDERPTVATVTDVEKVKEQAFFKNAQNGDRVVIYTNARKAILYRPSENRIIEVGAVNINQASPSPAPEEGESPAPSPTPSPQVEETPVP
jgi:hypothetical protein